MSPIETSRLMRRIQSADIRTFSRAERIAEAVYVVLLAGLLAFLFWPRDSHADDVVPTAHRTEVRVIVHWMPNRTAQRVCAQMGAWGGVDPKVHQNVGCNSYDSVTNVCELYLAEPTTVDDSKTTVLGHELYHCFSGAYHTQESL